MRQGDAVTVIARRASAERATTQRVVSKGQLVLLIALCVIAGLARADFPGVVLVSTQPFTCTLGPTGICTPQNPGPLHVTAGETFKIYVIRQTATDFNGNPGQILEIYYPIAIYVRNATHLDPYVLQTPSPPGPVRSITLSIADTGVYQIIVVDGLAQGIVSVVVEAAPAASAAAVPTLSEWALVALSLLVLMATLGGPLRYRLRRRRETR